MLEEQQKESVWEGEREQGRVTGEESKKSSRAHKPFRTLDFYS